ncbi:MAG: D-sedoheptulose 7-phosphate isomerase [Chthoniobacter sp.]|jgi:D-sedoheptulose 7-phosphate isomerase|nr:D-sedoheptulose 7-phosphate isomerase [Chthoniobacter sp.]
MTILDQATRDAVATLQSLADFQPQLDRAAELTGACLTSGGKLLVCGNGGSAGDGADFATEFACRFVTDRRPYPALNLVACGSLLTANANDYGVEEMFARSVRAFGKPGDVLFALTTSGNSANILAALRAGQEMGLHTIALLGRDGGRARGLAEIELIIPSQITARIQEAHRFLLHVLCEMVETGWLLKA